MKITVEIDQHNSELEVMEDQCVITRNVDNEDYVDITVGASKLIVDTNELMEALSKFV